MTKLVCDRCGKDIGHHNDGRLEFWDKSFGQKWEGVIWSVQARGNYMNSKVDLCLDCMKVGLKLLTGGKE